MGKKADRIVLANLTAALENLGVVKVARLFEEAVEDTEALEDGLFEVRPKREAQFAKGIALIIKARKGAKRDDSEDDEEEDCDCSSVSATLAVPSALSLIVHPEKRIKETVKDFLIRMQHWTGLHISSNTPLTDMMFVDFNVKKLTKKMRKCQSITDLATLITKKTSCRVMVRESARGKLLPGAIRLTASSSAYVVCLA